MAAPAVAPRVHRWTPVLLALAAFLMVPVMPLLRAVVPIEQTVLLLVPALAACALVGWYAGGRLPLAIIFLAAAALLVIRPPAGGGAYVDLARGWALLTAATFGAVCVLLPDRPFFSRALSALGLAVGIALLLASLGAVTIRGAELVLVEQFAARNSSTMGAWQQMLRQYAGEWNQLVSRMPSAGALTVDLEQALREMSRMASRVFPALLALQSLAALGLSWTLYHRLARTRIGPPLGQLREFRFSDQLVWGLVAGLAIVLLPTMEPLQNVGLNLLVFFGALFALRGLGIIAWFLSPGGVATALAFVVAMLVWPVLAAIAAVAFGLGLGDTWLDWRRRARPSP